MTDRAPESVERVSPARRALGRGLESLLPARQTPAAPPAVAPPSEAGRPLELAVGLIDRNPQQTRTSFDPEKMKELARSIAATGVVQPIVVRPLPQGRYQLIMGERRLLASIHAGKATIPVIVRQVSNEQAMEMTIVENLQRADLNPMEQARAFHRLATEFKMSQEQVALRTGMDRASVANFIRLLRLPQTVQDLVESGQISFGHARALLALPTAPMVTTAADRILTQGLSVRQIESHVQDLLDPDGTKVKKLKIKEPLDPNVNEAMQLIQRKLGMRVRIEDAHGRGRVIIEYASLEDFDLLLDVFDAHP